MYTNSYIHEYLFLLINFLSLQKFGLNMIGTASDLTLKFDWINGNFTESNEK